MYWKVLINNFREIVVNEEKEEASTWTKRYANLKVDETKQPSPVKTRRLFRRRFNVVWMLRTSNGC